MGIKWVLYLRIMYKYIVSLCLYGKNKKERKNVHFALRLFSIGVEVVRILSADILHSIK